MRRAVLIIVGILAGVLVLLAAVVVGKARLERRFEGEVRDLLAKTNGAQPTILTESDLAGLPEPILRWLRYSGVVGRERPIRVRLHQVGEFRMSENRGWMPFTAEQVYTTDPPGYVWVATFRMAPLVSVFGRDRYADGTGHINMWVRNVIPVAQESGGGLNQGALLRYLNETM